MNNKGKLFVISGSSGVGKGTLLNTFLAKNENVKLSISFTTRAPRIGEIDGINYFFTTKNDFEKAIENNEFLEWAKYSDNYYGTKLAYVEKKLNEGNDVILEIDSQGALQVMKKYDNDATFIFILPPSIQELEQRLRKRGTESEEAIQKRLSAVRDELEVSREFDYQVVNDDFDAALNELQRIFEAQREA